MNTHEQAILRRAIFTMQSVDMFEKLRHVHATGKTKCNTCTYCTSIAPDLERSVTSMEELLRNKSNLAVATS